MSHGIYAALSGAVAQETSLETTAQNLANAQTAGYRGARPVFHEVLSQAGRPGSGPPLRFTADEAIILLLGADFMAQNFDAEYRAAAVRLDDWRG